MPRLESGVRWTITSEKDSKEATVLHAIAISLSLLISHTAAQKRAAVPVPQPTERERSMTTSDDWDCFVQGSERTTTCVHETGGHETVRLDRRVEVE
jgi:hypothetical protein